MNACARLVFYILLGFALVFLSMGKAFASEGTDDAVQVRVGLIDAVPSEQNVRLLGQKYSRSYIDVIAKQTRWDIEYTHGTLAECLRDLRQGKLDLIGPVPPGSFGEEMLYSGGKLGYVMLSLYCRGDDEKRMTGDAEKVKGSRIGTLNKSDFSMQLKHFIETSGWDVTVEQFSSIPELTAALEEGAIDFILDSGTTAPKTAQKVLPIWQAPECFITLKDRKALMDELNRAIMVIEMKYPFFQMRLQFEYVLAGLQISSPYHEAEREFIKNSPPLKVGFLPEQLPFYAASGGNEKARGIYIDYLKMIAAESGLQFEFAEVPTPQKLGEMLWAGDVDLTFVVYSEGNYSTTVTFTNTVETETLVAVVRRDRKELPRDAAVALMPTFNGMQSFFRNNYPDWRLSIMPDIDKCMAAVESGKCDVAFVPARYLRRENSMVTYSKLTTSDKHNIEIPISIAVSPKQPGALWDTLNTAILHMNRKEMDMVAHKNTEPTVSVNYLLSTYPLPSAAVFILFIGGASLTGLLFLRDRARWRENRLLQEKNRELSAALAAVEDMRISRDSYKAESEVDKLTQLFNKTTVKNIYDEKSATFVDDEQMAVYVIDLDRFKEANDTFGHQYGDKVLAEFAQSLRKIFRANDCIGRFGGDEFVVVLVGKLTKDVILQKAAQIHSAARNIVIDGKQAAITASIGIAHVTERGTAYDTAFGKADNALYTVKENGRDGYCLEPPKILR